MVLGAVLILCAGLLGCNRWMPPEPRKASREVLGELEQTMQRPSRAPAENGRICAAVYSRPSRKISTVEVKGVTTSGVLSIPAAGLELPVMAQWAMRG